MDTKDIKEIFTYHPVKEGQEQKYKNLRMNAYNFALLINEMCPDSREKSLAITKLQEAVMFANASIAIHE